MPKFQEIMPTEPDFISVARKHVLNKPRFRKGFRATSNDRAKYRSRHLTEEQKLFYKWIQEIQERLNLTDNQFAFLFLDILRDPIQTFRKYKNKGGHFPSQKTLKRLLYLDKISRLEVIVHKENHKILRSYKVSIDKPRKKKINQNVNNI